MWRWSCVAEVVVVALERMRCCDVAVREFTLLQESLGGGGAGAGDNEETQV